MNDYEIKSFTFFGNYYILLDNLPKKDKRELLEAIVDYMFKGVEPKLDGLNNAIWQNLVMALNKSKNNSLKSIGIGAPNGNQNASKKQTKNKPKTNQTVSKKQTKNKLKTNQIINQKQTNNISIFLFLFSNIYINNINNKNNIYSLFKEYLELRNKNKYTMTETVVKRLINKLNQYGNTDEDKAEIITNAINGAWKDFYPLSKQKKETTIYEEI